MTHVHIVVPDWVDDPARPSGGSEYDRRIARGLLAAGWGVQQHAAPGAWPCADVAAMRSLAEVVARLPDGSVVLVDGLIASAAPNVFVPASGRLRLVVLVHMLLGDGSRGSADGHAAARENAVLAAASAVITTSSWTRNRSIELYRLPPERVHVAPPGVDAAEPAAGSPDGGRLLCVGAVAPHKGQDVLLAALALTADRPWCCALVGPADPDFLELLRRRAAAEGIDDRLHFADALTGDALDRAYAGADVLVLASRGETYGMVVIEALARGLPVIATAVGGVPEAFGHTADGRRPGLLVAPDDPGALATALRSWSTDPDLRQRLRRAAADRRPALAAWDVTTDLVARALTAATTMP